MTKQADAYINKRIWLWLIIFWAIFVLSLAQWQGNVGRRFATAPVNFTVTSADLVYKAWETQGVHGRILLLFDDYPHMRGLAFYEGAPQLTSSNFIEFSIFNNIIRKIYLVVSDDQWRDFSVRKDIGVFRTVSMDKQGHYLFTMSGVPLIALPAASLPQIDEDVLVHVNNDRFPIDRVRTLLGSKGISSDMVTVYRSDRT